MANNAGNTKKGTSSRSRLLMIVTVFVLVIAAAIGFFGLHKDNNGIEGAASVAGVPGIESIPGSDKAAAQYVKTVQQANQIDASTALEEGSSAIPTILRSSAFEETSFSDAGGGYGNSCEHIQSKFPYCFASITSGRYDKQELANTLNQIAQACRPGMSPAQCRAAIEQLVKDGKLTKADGESLLNAYAQTGGANDALQRLLKDGKLNAAQVDEIEKACKRGHSDRACLDLLRRLVAEGKLSPADAMQLMSAYGHPMLANAFSGATLLRQLVNAGKLSAENAQKIAAACLHEDNCRLCKATIDELATTKQITAAVQKTLLLQFARACPGGDSAEDKAIADLLAHGDISGAVANALNAACRKGMPSNICHAMINRLLKSGQLTPEQAKALLAALHAKPDNSAGGKLLAQLLQSGRIGPDTADAIDKACRKAPDAVPGDCTCSTELHALMAQGKVSSLEVESLLKAFGQTSCQDSTGAESLSQLVDNGELSPEAAKELETACRKNMPPELCVDRLKRLVAEGKLSPDEARNLLAAFGKPGANELAGAGELSKLVGSGVISPTISEAIQNACRKGADNNACVDLLKRLMREGKLTPEQARALLKAFGKPGEGLLAPNCLANFVSAGQLNATVAKNINLACRQGEPIEVCLGLIQRETAAGILMADQGNTILKCFGREGAANLKGAADVGALVSTGLLNNQEAQAIQDACRSDAASTSACADYLKKLVSEGKLTPAQAAKLLAAYGKPPVTFAQANNKQQASLPNAPSDFGVPSIDGGGENSQLNQVLARQQAFIKDQANKQKIQEAESAMQSQASALFQAWYPPPLQLVVEGTVTETQQQQAGAGQTAAGVFGGESALAQAAEDANVETFKAGKIIFGMLNTQINSDQPGPVLATIVGGPLNGGKLLGTMAREDDKLLLRFTLINLPKAKASGAVNIVAVSPETARTALASNVDHHYLSRYGSLFASSFIQGFGQAVQQSGQTVSSGINGTVQTQPVTTSKQKALIALGDTAQKMSDNLSDVINRQPTVTLNEGASLGLLFLTDFKVNKDLLGHSSIQGIEDEQG